MANSPFSSVSSRTAYPSVRRMSIIVEDDSLPPSSYRSSPPHSRSTRQQKYARLPVPRPPFPYPTYPPPAYSRSTSRDSTGSTISTRSLLSNSNSGSRPSSGASTPRNSYRADAKLLPITTPVGPTAPSEKLEDPEWIARRRNWYRLTIIAIIAVGLVVGLSIGLTIGLRKQSPAASNDTPVPSNLFPSGSFAFNTVLLESSTGCTSDPATWRCYPYQMYDQSSNGSIATFFWTIAPRNSYTYQVSSSSPSSVAPQFANQTMVLLEGNSYNERLVFNFSIPKTVASTSNTTAASCTFSNTVFRATLWTRRNTTTPVAARPGANATAAASPDGSSNWATWPGQVQIEQIKSGGPDCKDLAGKEVKVAPGHEQCRCLYTNYGLEVPEKRSKEWEA